jgi:hypothetical protein
MINTDLKQINTDIRANRLLIRVYLLIGFLLALFPIFYYCVAPSFAYLLSTPARAQSFSLAISPPLLELMIMPGKSYLQPYTVTNTGTKITITPSITTFSPKDENGRIKLNSPRLQLPSATADGGQAISFQFDNPNIKINDPFEIDANETKNLNLRITIPTDAEEKDYYLTLLLSSQPNISRIESGSQQTGVIGANLLITVSKDGKPLKSAEISEFRLSNSLFSVFSFQFSDSFDQPQYKIRIKNTGRTYWKPVGFITTTGTLNQKWTNDLQSDNILANSIREISLATPSAQPNFLIGAYKTTLSFQPDEENEKILKSFTFIALPIKLILGIVIAMILLRTISLYIRRRS